MAEQQGHMLSRGTVNNLNYYIDKNGNYKFRSKSKLQGDKIKTDPAFALTRQNMSEFSKAATAGKIIRTAMALSITSAADNSVLTRLFTVMNKIIKSDPVSLRGERSVMKGNQAFLNGFEFNSKSPLSTTLKVRFTTAFDRVTGQTTLNLPAFVPGKQIASPEGSTHCKIISVSVGADFDSGDALSASAETALIPLSLAQIPAVNLVTQLEPNSTKLLMHAVGVEFLMIVNGVEYPMQNKAFNTIGIVEVSPSV
jgi:hypothetical protein